MEVREPAIAYSKRKYSIEEYLELENAATEKHEYYRGEIFAMSGAKSQHIIVNRNLMISLGNSLKGKPCQPYGNDTRIHIPENSLFTYPDLSVICGDLVSLNDDDLNFLNPLVIFEVLSPSTANYDRGEKFRLYKDIPTFREYVLIDPEVVSLDVFYLQGSEWVVSKYNSLDQKLLLQSLDIELPLADVYEGTRIAKQHEK